MAISNSESLTIEQKIKHIFDSDLSNKKEELLFILGRLHQSSYEAEKMFRARLFLFLFSWIVFYAISVDLVRDIGQFPIRLENIKIIIVFAPIAISLIAYNLIATKTISLYLEIAIGTLYGRISHTFAEADMDILLFPPSFLTLEWFHEYTGERFGTIWLKLIKGIYFIGPTIAFFHLSYILIIGDYANLYVVAASIILGFLVLLRSHILVYTSRRYTEGW